MNKSEIKKEYQKLYSKYESLGNNLVEAIKSFLKGEQINYLDVYFRVKDFDSFAEKIERKNYKVPFDEIEDICGVRIICYYISDTERIAKIIEKEFKVLERQDKADLLGPKEFAYRSNHFVVKIDPSWIKAPNYRELKGLKTEIQVRTILMHAWAEVEHKLNYKSVTEVPKQFLRKLYRLSAKFEEADEQFEELKQEIKKYQVEITEKAISANSFDITQEFNLNTLQAFIFFHLNEFPEKKDLSLKDLHKYKIGFKELDQAIAKMKPYLHDAYKDIRESGYGVFAESITSNTLLYFSLDVVYNQFFKERKNNVSFHTDWMELVKKWKKKITVANK